ncbi:OLC1v1033264C1 [Oldenlandia corymbosa var. corymbosa]|uniref:OLC1v1033264C1 n=1 Tax=Oldenlandia corymbosa var. corymbosa TaxID=529605 RepID=A0AAV1CN07_OLDCO|nr:OLC1v1033264C1 [Oldenlandia corymbosa var. corymbosa]
MMAKPSSLVDFLPLLIFFVISACFIYTRSRRRRGRKAIPPGPPQIPLVGNLFQLGGIFHRTLAKLAQIYGPIMTIKILSKTIVIISSPDLAKELVRKHDHTFTARQVLDSFRALDHHKYSILFLPADKQWRRLRKLCTEQMFSNERLNASQGLRQEKVQQLRDHIYHCCKTGETVNIRAVAFTTALNLMSYTLFSVDFANYDSDASHELQEAIHGAANLLGVLNLVDYYPVLRWFDPQGIRRRTKFHFGKLLQAFDGIISHRLKERDSSKKNDLLAVLLEKYHHGEADWSYNDIKHLILWRNPCWGRKIDADGCKWKTLQQHTQLRRRMVVALLPSCYCSSYCCCQSGRAKAEFLLPKESITSPSLQVEEEKVGAYVWKTVATTCYLPAVTAAAELMD